MREFAQILLSVILCCCGLSANAKTEDNQSVFQTHTNSIITDDHGYTNNLLIDYGYQWRIANEEDNIDDWAIHNAPNEIGADFDGDGQQDVARILLKRNNDIGTKVVAVVSNFGNFKQFTLFENEEMQAQSFALELLEPSDEVWESACQKGYYDCEKGDIRQFKITKPTLYLCYIESACTVYLWSNHQERFIKVPVSD